MKINYEYYSSNSISKGLVQEVSVSAKFQRHKPKLGYGGCLLMAAAALSAHNSNAAESEKKLVLEEIVVTAQKREESAMDTPLSLTALNSQSMEDRQVDSLEDINLVAPGVRSGMTNGVNRLFIRGIGLQSFASGSDASAGFYVDGVFVGRPSFQITSFFDVDRLEVVRGPQGTLYGRNATAGAVNLLTQRPTEEFSGYVDVTAGNYKLLSTTGAVSGPLNTEGSVRGRLAFNTLNRDGYGTDLAQNHHVNDANQRSFRGTLEFFPSDDLDVTLIAEHHLENDNNYYTMSFGAYPGYTLEGVSDTGDIPAGIEESNSFDAATDLRGNTNTREASALTALVNYDINDMFSFSSITGWRKGSRVNDTNSDNTSAGLINTYYHEDNEQFSQEFQLNYEAADLSVVAGLYYYEEDITNYVLVPFVQFDEPGEPPVEYIQDGTMDISAIAAFTQATYSVTDKFRATLGLRYSRETREHVGQFTGLFVPVYNTDADKTWSSVTPKVGFEYDVTADTLLYASWTEGFKSGTYNVGQNNSSENNPDGVVNPEEVEAYEVGFKSRLMDGRVELSGAGFWYDYTDLQVNKIIGIATLTVNAGEAENKGIELATRAQLTERIALDANLTWIDATFTDFSSTNPLFPDEGEQDLTGNQLPGAPEYAAGIGLSYTVPMDSGALVTARLDASYSDNIYFSEFNDKAISQESVTKINTLVRYESAGGDYSVTLWGKNITDEYIASNITLGVGLSGFPRYGAVEPPRTFGVTLGMKF